MMWMNSQVWPLRTTAAYSTFRVQEPLPSFVISRAIPYPTVVAMAMVPWSHGCHHLARPGLSVNKSCVYLGTRNPSDAHPTRGYISYYTVCTLDSTRLYRQFASWKLLQNWKLSLRKQLSHATSMDKNMRLLRRRCGYKRCFYILIYLYIYILIY